jgi:beta-mannanase
MNHSRFLFLLLTIALFTLTFVSHAQEITHQATPADSNANAATRNILNYLHQLPSLPGNRIISGQFGSYGGGTNYNTAMDQLREIQTMTGLLPGLTGMDYAMPGGIAEANRYLIDRWREGYLVTVSHHMRNPCTGGSSTDMNLTSTCNLRTMVQTGTDANRRWNAILDTAANGLLELQAAGVSVIWRPLHEMNGGWFWWTTTGEEFRALWIYMFNYFQAKGLNNLLWAYSPNSATQWSIGRLRDMYPGTQYVDIVGLDKYRPLAEDPLQFNAWGEYDFLVGTGKPFALLEYGPLPANASGWNTVNYNWMTFLNQIKQRYPRVVMFQAWEYVWRIGNPRFTGQREMMHDPSVVSLNELPNFRTGVIPPVTTVPPTTIPPTTVAPTTVAPTVIAPPPVNGEDIVGNGNFSAGTNGWGTSGQITSRVNNGVFEFYQNVGGSQAVLFQNMARPNPSRGGFEVRVDLGNSSGVRKRTVVILHDRDFSDLNMCSIWLEANAPLRTYVMQTASKEAWTSTMLSIYSSANDGQGWVRLDNVSVVQSTAVSVTQTKCINPLQSEPVGGAPSSNLLRNGTFDSALAPWFTWGAISGQVSGGVYQFGRRSGNPAGVVGQYTGVALPVNAPVEARLQLGNAGSTRARANVILHNADFTDLQVCVFWLEPNTPLQNFVVRTKTTRAWNNASLSVYPAVPLDSTGFRMDNVSLRHVPAQAVTGTECYEPGSGVAESTGDVVTELQLAMPTLEPTATPGGLVPAEGAQPLVPLVEPTLIATATPALGDPSLSSGDEGMTSESLAAETLPVDPPIEPTLIAPGESS